MRKFHSRLFSICCLLLAIMLIPIGTALADDDDGTNEVGVYWVADYNFHNDLPNSDDSAGGFIGVIDDYYTSRFNEGDDDVTQSDFESNNGADTVDICWYQGHGDPGTLILQNDFFPFWWDRSSYGSCDWGDTDLEWIMLHACQTLADDTGGEKDDGQFANSLNGMRLICGADTSMLNFAGDGAAVANRLVDSDGGGPDVAQTVKESWFLGIDQTHGAGNTLRVIAEGYLWGYDYIWGQGTGPYNWSYSVDDYYYSWSWNCS